MRVGVTHDYCLSLHLLIQDKLQSKIYTRVYQISEIYLWFKGITRLVYVSGAGYKTFLDTVQHSEEVGKVIKFLDTVGFHLQ